MSLSDSVTVSMLVAVDPATAFAVFTEDVDIWWKRGPAYRVGGAKSGVMRFVPGAGGRLLEEVDRATGETYEIGKVLVWDPPQRLVFEFRIPIFTTEQCTEVDVRFQPDGEGTRVSVEHRGWDGLPDDHPVRHGLGPLAYARMRGGWWMELLRGLRGRASGG